jgi:hypothetical protein
MDTAESLKAKQAEMVEVTALVARDLPPGQQFLREKEPTAAATRTFCEDLELEVLSTHAARVDLIAGHCKARCVTTNAGTDDDHSIYYLLPPGSDDAAQAQRRAYSSLVDENIEAFNIVPGGSLGERVSLLRGLLEKADRLYQLRVELQHGTPKPGALLKLIEFTIPCLLHLENRSREAFFSRILNRVFDPARTTVEVKAKLAAVEDFINTHGHGVGVTGRLGQTKITVNVKSDAINKLTFNNDRIRKIMKSVGHDVVDMCFRVNDPGRARAHEALDLYEKLIDKLRQHGDLSGTEIDEVSTLCSATYGKYLDTFGYEGLTNYWHIIGSCHLVYYLRNYGSLYRYQNQGWEHMNHLLKRFFFTRTQRGGRNGAGARSSRVRAVGKWMQRRLMWLCDFVDAPAVNVAGLKRKKFI